MIQGDHKLIDRHGGGPSYTLFDLALDPWETIDQSTQQPGRMQQLSALLEAFRGQHGDSAGPEVTIEVDDALYRHLEALGYVDPGEGSR
ncbi:MAG TPA: hypothetical protein ENK18_18210 [Deltaproteobacteria bacterium]|nr:hypothetical protein [Deltaproteobacteria bacterium]